MLLNTIHILLLTTFSINRINFLQSMNMTYSNYNAKFIK